VRADRRADLLGKPDDGLVTRVVTEQKRGEESQQGDERKQNLGHCSGNLSESFKRS
jgi:hypothetical protein